MKIALPTLSTRGWATTTESIIDNVMLHYSSNNPSQSYTYQGNIYSLQSAIKDGAGNMRTVCVNVAYGLTQMLKRYFPLGAEVDCTYDSVNGNPSLVNLNITGYVNTDSGSVNLARSLENINSHYVDVMNVKILK